MTAPALVGPPAAEAPSPRELRADVRHWRRGRADTSWLEVAQDAYVAVFATLLIGAMAGNVVLNLRRGSPCRSCSRWWSAPPAWSARSR